MIHVTPKDNDTFTVTVEEGGSRSTFQVTLDDDYHQQRTGNKLSKEDFIRQSFEFLLEREPKEAILSSFHLKVISQYFPEYDKTVPKK